MKNKKLIYTGIIFMALIGIYLYIAVKKAKATSTPATSTATGATGTATSTPATSTATGATGTATSTPASSFFTLPSWLDWLTGTSETSPAQEQYTTTIYVASNFPLKYGSKGTEVLNLQRYLNNNLQIPFNKLTEDGSFGILTQGALLRTLGVMEASEQWYRTNILNF